MRGSWPGGLKGGFKGWRKFWRRLQRRMRLGRRRSLAEIRFLEVPKNSVLLPGIRVPEEPLPGKRVLNDPPGVGQKINARQETLLELVEAMGVRPIDPRESEAYLQAWLELTSRQKQVVCLACAGHTNMEIAKRLRISPNTVKSHLHLALGRFGVRSRAEMRVALAGWDFSRVIDFSTPDR